MKRKCPRETEFDSTMLPKEILNIIGSFFIRNMQDLYPLLNVSKIFHSFTLENWMKFVGIHYSPQYKIWASKHSKYIVNISDELIDINMHYPNVQRLKLKCHWRTDLKAIMKACPNVCELVLKRAILKDQTQYIPLYSIKMLSTYNWFPELFCKCTQLTHLDLNSSHQLTTLDGIEVLVNLIYLDIGQTKVEKIDSLPSLENLKYLNIYKTWVTKISNLKSCEALELLCFDGKHITDWTEFNNYKQEVKIIQPQLWKMIIQKIGVIPITSIFPVYDP